MGRRNLGVAQLVARYLGVVEAARSSRVTQTNAKLVFARQCREAHTMRVFADHSAIPAKKCGYVRIHSATPTHFIRGYGGIGRRARFRF